MSNYLICFNCGNEFYDKHASCKRYELRTYNKKYYCCRKCQNQAKGHQTLQETACTNCGKIFLPTHNLGKRSKSTNRFCSKSCAASYNNKHKAAGTRRSKLEKWLEEKLSTLYPNLEIKYCDKTAINSELDIYIPSFKLAFELNGIYHYEPIHGQNKLEQIQRNDANKFQLCQENNISLCIIDTSQHKYVTEKSSKKYLDIIVEIIEQNKKEQQ